MCHRVTSDVMRELTLALEKTMRQRQAFSCASSLSWFRISFLLKQRGRIAYEADTTKNYAKEQPFGLKTDVITCYLVL